MVRITKLTDYGVVIMALMAGSPRRLFQTQEIADYTAVAKPTVSKLLKMLTKNKFLSSHRGTKGGYHLACTPDQITIADLIGVLEGPIAITECNLGHGYCNTSTQCAIKAPWQRINQTITAALQSVKLSDLANSFGLPGGKNDQLN